MPNKSKYRQSSEEYRKRIDDANKAKALASQRTATALGNLLFRGELPEVEVQRPGTFGGGRSGGAGYIGGWKQGNLGINQDLIDYLPLMTQRSFSEAFGEARRQGLPDFMFNGKRYTTEVSDNPKYTKAEFETYLAGTLRRVKDYQGNVYPDSTMVLPNPMIYGEYNRDEDPNPSIFADGGELKGWQKGLGLAGSLAPTLVGAIQEMNPDTSTIQDMADAKIKEIENQRLDFTGMSLDDVLNQQAMFRGYDLDDNSSDFYQRESTGSILGRAASSAAQGAVSGSSMGPWGAAISGLASGALTLAGGLFGRNKKQEAADKAASDVLAAKRKKNAYNQASFATMASSLQAQNDRNLFTQLAAYGGPLGISLRPVDSAIDYMQNEELLTQLGEDMTKRNNRRTSMPLFAFGGAMPGYGGNWTNGLSFVNTGGSHEQNPLGGVPFGIAQDGNPNMVEEGEVVWNDYVYSNRLEVPKDILKKYKLGNNLTFAEAVKKAQKNYSERPNDPIEKRSTDAILADLMQSQEQVRAEKAQQDAYNEAEAMAAFAADGGDIHIAKNKRGTFTAAASKHGMGVQEFAGHVLANKDKYSSAMVKKANFARNASKWHHALGGHLFAIGGPTDPPYGTRLYGNYKNGHSFISTSPMDAYIPTYENYSVQEMFNPWDTYGTALFAPHRAQRTLSNEAKANVKPYTQESIKQNPTPIYLSDDSEMNRYIAATNPLAITDMTSREYDNSGELRAQGMTVDDLAKSLEAANKSKGSFDPLPTTGWQSGLIYAPLLGGFSVLSDALGWTNKPDYSYADAIDKAALEASQNGFDVDITPEYIGDYMKHNPFDRLFYANESGAQTAGTNSAIMNTGNANMGATTAALLANNYNGIIGQGKLFREGEEFNLDQRYKVTDFNRDTNMFNSEQNLKAQLAKADARQRAASLVYEGAVRSNALRQEADQIANANRAANITTFLDNLAGVGEHFINKFDRNALINAGVFGTLSQRPYGVSDADWEDYVNKHRAIFGACGGKLNRRKKKGITV